MTTGALPFEQSPATCSIISGLLGNRRFRQGCGGTKENGEENSKDAYGVAMPGKNVIQHGK